MSASSSRNQLSALPWDTDIIFHGESMAQQMEQLKVSQLTPTTHFPPSNYIVRNASRRFFQRNQDSRPEDNRQCKTILPAEPFGCASADLQQTNVGTACLIPGWPNTSYYTGFLTSAIEFIPKRIAPLPFISAGLLGWENRNAS